MRVSDFDFSLPESLIAQRPNYPRSAARLLHVRPPDKFRDLTFADLGNCLQHRDLLVFNTSQVFASRLLGQRQRHGVISAGQIQVTLVAKTDAPDTWVCYAKPGNKLSPGDHLLFNDQLTATVLDKRDAEVHLGFATRKPDADLLSVIDASGQMPLPPYIKRPRDGDPRDKTDYRTFCGNTWGSLAAPTASLHFDHHDLSQLIQEKDLELAHLRLDVGLGTFAPVRTEQVEEHTMHSETCSLDRDNAGKISTAKAQGRRVVAIGTTVLRGLESLQGQAGTLETDIFITPGYRFNTVDALITNFHLPKSTLFMLVCAFSGFETMKTAYAHAIAHQYRFFSYGDGCFLEPSG